MVNRVSDPGRLDIELAQMDLTHVLEGVSALLDAASKAGYLDSIPPEHEGIQRLIPLFGVLEDQIGRACELSQRCEELQAAASKTA